MSYDLSKSVNLAVADGVRQLATKKSIKPMKSLAVGGSCYLAEMTGLYAYVEQLINSIAPTVSDPMIINFLVQSLSTGVTLYGLDKFNLINSSDAQLEGSSGGASAMRSVYLGMADSAVAQVLAKFQLQLYPDGYSASTNNSKSGSKSGYMSK